MRRRDFIAGLGGVAAWPVVSRAQEAQRARIGWITVATHPFIDGFGRGLRELGWTEGEKFVIDFCYADGHSDRLDGLAIALARDRLAVVIASFLNALTPRLTRYAVRPKKGAWGAARTRRLVQ
jgi:putative ABC transport system substrate-binding protein